MIDVKASLKRLLIPGRVHILCGCLICFSVLELCMGVTLLIQYSNQVTSGSCCLPEQCDVSKLSGERGIPAMPSKYHMCNITKPEAIVMGCPDAAEQVQTCKLSRSDLCDVDNNALLAHWSAALAITGGSLLIILALAVLHWRNALREGIDGLGAGLSLGFILVFVGVVTCAIGGITMNSMLVHYADKAFWTRGAVDHSGDVVVAGMRINNTNSMPNWNGIGRKKASSRHVAALALHAVDTQQEGNETKRSNFSLVGSGDPSAQFSNCSKDLDGETASLLSWMLNPDVAIRYGGFVLFFHTVVGFVVVVMFVLTIAGLAHMTCKDPEEEEEAHENQPDVLPNGDMKKDRGTYDSI